MEYVLPPLKKETIPRYETFVINRELCLRYKEIFRQEQLEEISPMIDMVMFRGR
jgi:hypothetical protein